MLKEKKNSLKVIMVTCIQSEVVSNNDYSC